MKAHTQKLRRAMMTIRELPPERQDELAETLLQYAGQFQLPIIR